MLARKQLMPERSFGGGQEDLERIDWRLPFRRMRHALAQHYGLIIVSCVVSLLLLVLYRQLFPPIYVARVVIQAEANDDPVRSTYYANWNVFRKTDLPSEPEFVTTGRVVEGVVRQLGLRFDDVHHGLWTHAAYLWTESWLGRRYRAFKKWLFPPPPGAYQPTDEEIDAARTVDAFAKSVSVEVVRGTTFASIEVKAPTFRAAEYVNLLADTYLAERNRQFRGEADAAFEALQSEVARARAELTELEDRRLAFDKANKIVLDFEKDKLVVSNWATLQASIYDIRSSIESLEATRAVIERQLAREPAEIVASKSIADSRVKGLLQTREFELSEALRQLKDRYRPDSPEVRQLQQQLDDTRATLSREAAAVEIAHDRTVNPVYNDLRQRLNLVQGQLASARASLAEKQAPLAELEKRMYSVPVLIKQIGAINRDREGLELRYKLLRERAMMADVSRATVSLTTPSVRITDYARPSADPAWPKNIVVVPAALGMGLFIGLALALLLELLNTRVNRDRLASRRDMPIYAAVRLPSGVPAGLRRMT